MKASILLLLFSIGLCLQAQNTTQLTPFKQIPNLDQILAKKRILKSDTNNIKPLTNDLIVNQNKQSGNLHFPYPIIFIHGLASSADTWMDFYDAALTQGWLYGGNLPFCLNGDNDLYNTDITSSTTSDVYNFMPTDLPCADFYFVNFNVTPNGTIMSGGSNPVQSNQAAIVKQGLAISVAVKAVLEATGRDKVILFGHSMGGLAARQYIQSPDLWLNDGEHHVAKLVTTGTPHGGSNATASILTNFFTNANERSDAIRDLRTNYFWSGSPGVFLFGGIEDPDLMDDSFAGFYDYDVNCNFYWYDSFEGLNQRNLYSNIDYSCIASDWVFDLLGGDGVVSWTSANLKNYYSGLMSETFWSNVNHIEMPELIQLNYEGFDEPDQYYLAYEVEIEETYNGFITNQADDAPFFVDFDDFRFDLVQNGWVTIDVNNVQNDMFLSIVDHPSYNILLDDESSGAGNFTTTPLYLTAGTYYLELYGFGDNTSWQYPYNFQIQFSTNPPVGINEVDRKMTKVSIFPNPANNYVKIEVDTDHLDSGELRILNMNGQTVMNDTFMGSISKQYDISTLPSGMYLIRVNTQTSNTVKRLTIAQR